MTHRVIVKVGTVCPIVSWYFLSIVWKSQKKFFKCKMRWFQKEGTSNCFQDKLKKLKITQVLIWALWVRFKNKFSTWWIWKTDFIGFVTIGGGGVWVCHCSSGAGGPWSFLPTQWRIADQWSLGKVCFIEVYFKREMRYTSEGCSLVEVGKSVLHLVHDGPGVVLADCLMNSFWLTVGRYITYCQLCMYPLEFSLL